MVIWHKRLYANIRAMKLHKKQKALPPRKVVYLLPEAKEQFDYQDLNFVLRQLEIEPLANKIKEPL